MKEFLSVRGIAFESVNVLEDGGMDKLRALGARSIPIVARDGKFVFAQVIKDVVDFLLAMADAGQVWNGIKGGLAFQTQHKVTGDFTR